MALILTPDEIRGEMEGQRYNMQAARVLAKAQAQHMRDAIDEFEKDYWAPPEKITAKQFCEKYHISVPDDMPFDSEHFRVVFNLWIAAEGLD